MELIYIGVQVDIQRSAYTEDRYSKAKNILLRTDNPRQPTGSHRTSHRSPTYSHHRMCHYWKTTGMSIITGKISGKYSFGQDLKLQTGYR